MYPLLREIAVNSMDIVDSVGGKKKRSVELMMHTCGLVQIGSLEDKLEELIPIAEQALQIEGNDEGTQKIKLIAMQLFRKILFLNPNSSQADK